MKRLLITFCLVFSICTIYAQKSERDSSEVSISYFQGTISYLSNAVYYGRKDTLRVPYLTPTIAYHNKTGLYVDASLSYLTKAPGRIDLITFDGGYDFSIGENFSSEVLASKYFYNSNSTSTKSHVKGEVISFASYSTPILTLNTGLDIAFSNKTDFIISYGISHPFYFEDEKGEWSIEASILSYVGTQKFHETAKEKLANSGIKITGADQFVVLDYEFSTPILYEYKKWGFSLTPSYSIPLNPLTIIQSNGKVHTLETLSNSFYTELAIYLKF